MAKWGEGDPRWIVEERPDATNVNNWHWTEKNATPWSRDRLHELFKDVVVPNEKANVSILKVDKLTGEAFANNRKGKLIFFYEWDLTLKWKGQLNGSELVKEGTLQVLNLSEEYKMSETDVKANIEDDNSDEASLLKTILRHEGKKFVQERLEEYLASLTKEFSQGMILPKKEDGAEKSTSRVVVTPAVQAKKELDKVVVDSKNSVGCKLDTKTIKMTRQFQCRASEFYNAFTTVELVSAFTRSPAEVDPTRGGKFVLFEGNISGTFEKLEPNKMITQRWRCKQWPAGHFSDVAISIEEKDDHTEVKLKQEGVPSTEEESTKANWDRYYWNPIKHTFGFGTFL